MLLDAWLKIGIFGPIILIVLLLGALGYGVALFYALASCRKLLREREMEQFWLTVFLLTLLIVPIAALILK